MNWFYAAGGQQQGPVDDAQLDVLIASGQLKPDTLVWHEGMTNWQPLRDARPTAGAAAPSANPAAPPVIGGSANEVICAECGKTFTKDNAIQYGTSWVCATCKPVFLQKLREGAAPGYSPGGPPGGPFDPDAFLAAIRDRDYSIDIGSCLTRGWELVKANFWISIGVVALIYVCLFAAGAIPCIGYPLQLVVQGPLMGGLYWFFLKLIRRQEPAVSDAFAGFSLAFLHLFLVGLVTSILTGLCMLPGIASALAVSIMKIQIPMAVIVGLFLVGIIPAVYLTVCWMFSMALVIDKRMEFWPAMELSRNVISMHWGGMFVFLLVCGLVTVAGFLALCVGVLVAAPVVMAAITYAYEDIFGSGTASPA